LYLIAAYRNPQELGRSSLLGMTALARTPAEERRFRAMTYLLGDDHDPATVVHHYVAVNLARRLMNMTRLMRDADL